MKNRFTTLDTFASVFEIQAKLRGLRVLNIYNIDNKTYLIRLTGQDTKAVILIESGIRIHSTVYDWPKSNTPSSFAMKMRKHIRGRRLESCCVLGIDRIVDLQFGSGEAAYHLIIELYDTGNIVLTDCKYVILNILRRRTDKETSTRFVNQVEYPIALARAKKEDFLDVGCLTELLKKAAVKTQLKKVFASIFPYGPALLQHVMLFNGLNPNLKVSADMDCSDVASKIQKAFSFAVETVDKLSHNISHGYIVVQDSDLGEGAADTYVSFDPLLLEQNKEKKIEEHDSFMMAVDAYYSKIEVQRSTHRVSIQEKQAYDKIANVKTDHEKRLNRLRSVQETGEKYGTFVELNLELVDKCITFCNKMVDMGTNWDKVEQFLAEQNTQDNPIANTITKIDFDKRTAILQLHDPYLEIDDESNEVHTLFVTIDLKLTAFQNIKRLHSDKKTALKKEGKILKASEMALKNAEKKAMDAMKVVSKIETIQKHRKTFWFEKFYWFLSSDGYLVIGGIDRQQNELIVKRYLQDNDIYVHADIHGASSIIVKNPSGEAIPPKTLREAGIFAACHSVSWNANVTTRVWWVYSHQVTKTAPTGEYLSTGSFMIRGKKNYLPIEPLVMGFGFLFKIDEESEHNAELTEQLANEDSEQEQEFPDLAVKLPSIDIDGSGEKEDEFSIVDPLENTVSSKKSKKQREQESKIEVKPQLPQKEKKINFNKKLSKKAKKKIMRYKEQDREEQLLRVKGTLDEDENFEQQPNKDTTNAENGEPHEGEKLPAFGSFSQDDLAYEQKHGIKKAPAAAPVPEAEIDYTMDEENLVETNEGNLFRFLTAYPRPSDTILWCVPICAPYPAMVKYKYKIKLVPGGTQKRGQLVKTAFSVMTSDKSVCFGREKDVVKAVKDQDLCKTIMGNAKISAPSHVLKKGKK